MMVEKPQTYSEFEDLLEKREIEVLDFQFFGPIGDATVSILILDYRRTYEQGEIYQVNFPNPGFELESGKGEEG